VVDRVSQRQLAAETDGIVIGNHTQKYTARNPAIRWLTERWVANLDRVFGRIADDPPGRPERALEVGCGEGVIADKMQRRWGEVVAWTCRTPACAPNGAATRRPGSCTPTPTRCRSATGASTWWWPPRCWST
jgi:hypothetical protein